MVGDERWELETGLTGRVSIEVDEARTARSLGSGDVEVLGTPAVVALAEAAACAAVAGRLPDERTSVGTRVELDHLAPTLPGRVVTAEATLSAIGGRTLEFDVSVSDEAGVVARGRHVRAVVDRTRFVESAEERADG
ncbi:MAG TPA: hotdog domain-containing protein [Actinomycetota bacterium]|nr:hotdog domain-containing protein [Actinomycetota bacterium]